MSFALHDAVDVLRAAGEPSRLRIVALLAREERRRTDGEDLGGGPKGGLATPGAAAGHAVGLADVRIRGEAALVET